MSVWETINSEINKIKFENEKKPLFDPEIKEKLYSALNDYLSAVKKKITKEDENEKDYKEYIVWLEDFLNVINNSYEILENDFTRSKAGIFLTALEGKSKNIDQKFQYQGNKPNVISNLYYNENIGLFGENGFLESLDKKITNDKEKLNRKDYSNYFDIIEFLIDNNFTNSINNNVLTKNAQETLLKSLNEWNKKIKNNRDEFKNDNPIYKRLNLIFEKINSSTTEIKKKFESYKINKSISLPSIVKKLTLKNKKKDFKSTAENIMSKSQGIKDIKLIVDEFKKIEKIIINSNLKYETELKAFIATYTGILNCNKIE